MATYHLVPKAEWQRALNAIEAAAKALKQAGTATLPDTQPALPMSGPQRRTAARKSGAGVKDGQALAQKVIERVDTGGHRHRPKAFDRHGPKIADFVYLLANGDFAVPEMIDPVKKYVALKESRRLAGGQVRTAVRLDDRFQQGPGGRYSKVQ